MPATVPLSRRVSTAATWPLGVAYTSWSYLWRVLAVHRVQEAGDLQTDGPPEIPAHLLNDEVQLPQDGVGPLWHRRYDAAIADAKLGPAELIERIKADPNQVVPRQIARFHRSDGSSDRILPGDHFLVQMPGPWNGPVRTVDVSDTHFRFATLSGHLEAGQIEWRAWRDDLLHFTIESWSRGGDHLSALLHDHLRMAREVQLYMWTSVLQRVTRLSGGHLVDGVTVLTRKVDEEALEGA